MNLYRKNIWVIVIFIILMLGLPVMLNYILLIPAFAPIIGDSATWLSFWASFISSIASFAMIVVTYLSLRQGREQLNEIKRQWAENNRPRIYGRIITYQSAFFLELYNAGREDANCVEVKINNEFYDNLSSDMKPIFDSMVDNPFFVGAGKSVYFLIGVCKEISQQWRDKDFSIIISGKYNNIYDLYINLPIQHFINKIHMIVRTPLEHALEDISEGLVRPHLASHPKPIQVNIETITRCLETLTKHLTRQDGDNENSKS